MTKIMHYAWETRMLITRLIYQAYVNDIKLAIRRQYNLRDTILGKPF